MDTTTAKNFLACLSVLLLVKITRGHFDEEPESQSARVGDDVIMTCIIESHHSENLRLWYMRQMDSSSNALWIPIANQNSGVKPLYRDHYQLVDRAGGGSGIDFSLRVRSVQHGEPALKCEFIGDDSEHEESAVAEIYVTDSLPGLLEMAMRSVDAANAVEVTEELVDLIDQPDTLNVFDLPLVSVILENVASTQTNKPAVTENVVEILNNLMMTNQSVLSAAQAKNASSSRSVMSLETLASQLRLADDEINMASSNVTLQVLESLCGSLPGFDVPTGGESEISAASITWGNDTHSLLDETCEPENARIVYTFYRNGALFTTSSRDSEYSHVTVGGAVISATVLGDNNIITGPVTVTFTTTTEDQPICVFWDFSLAEGRGGWSDKGCTLTSHEQVTSQDATVVCTCDHLTNFAVIFDHAGGRGISAAHHMALSIITIIGLALSIAGLLGVILTFCLFRNFRESPRNRLLCQLAVALLGTDVLFIATSSQLSGMIECRMVAALLHYFLLSTFCWLLLEGVFYFQKLGRAFPADLPHFDIISASISWVTPAIVVVVSLIVDVNHYTQVGPEKYCWLSRPLFYWGFLLPVAMVMMVNLGLYILIIKNVTCGRLQQATSGKDADIRERRKRLKATILIFLTLGLTWSLGFFAIEEASLAVQYMFCLINSLHGVLLFWLHVLRDNNSLEAWKNILFQTTSNEPVSTTSATSRVTIWRAGRPVVVNYGEVKT